MPYKDDVTTLKKFARARNVDAQRWVLLTGRRTEIYDLGRRFYFVEEDAGEKRDTTVFLHTENIVLTDKHRHIRGIYNGLSISSIQNLINDIRELQRE